MVWNKVRLLQSSISLLFEVGEPEGRGGRTEMGTKGRVSVLGRCLLFFYCVVFTMIVA